MSMRVLVFAGSRSQLLQHSNGIADNDLTLIFLQIPDEFPIDLNLMQWMIL